MKKKDADKLAKLLKAWAERERNSSVYAPLYASLKDDIARCDANMAAFSLNSLSPYASNLGAVRVLAGDLAGWDDIAKASEAACLSMLMAVHVRLSSWGEKGPISLYQTDFMLIYTAYLLGMDDLIQPLATILVKLDKAFPDVLRPGYHTDFYALLVFFLYRCLGETPPVSREELCRYAGLCFDDDIRPALIDAMEEHFKWSGFASNKVFGGFFSLFPAEVFAIIKLRGFSLGDFNGAHTYLDLPLAALPSQPPLIDDEDVLAVERLVMQHPL